MVFAIFAKFLCDLCGLFFTFLDTLSPNIYPPLMELTNISLNYCYVVIEYQN